MYLLDTDTLTHLYAKTIPQTLPDWGTAVTKGADLFEVEINDSQPDFQSLLEELETVHPEYKHLLERGVSTNYQFIDLLKLPTSPPNLHHGAALKLYKQCCT